jgi:NADPH2:quinone reductase
MQSMKAIVVDAPGGPDVLHLRDMPVPEPGPDQVLVKIAAAGINYIDVYFRNGMYKGTYPLVLGQEGAGVIEKVGSNVTDLKPGERVAYCGTQGSYAEYATVPASHAVPVPEGVDLRDAAALMLQGSTAHYLANSTFPLKPEHVALIHAGAGGVGLLLTQMAKAKGATVITTVSTPEKAELSKRAGADHVIDYSKQDFAAEARRITDGRGVDVVYDSVGLTTWEKSLDALRPLGYFVLFGASSGAVPPIDLQMLNAKGGLFATRPSLVWYIATPQERRARASDIFREVLDGTLSLRIEHVYPLADAAKAHTDLEARATTGKLILLP